MSKCGAMKKYKSLITGGAGFIGSNLAEKLIKNNHDVIIVDNLATGQLKNLKKIKNKIKFINIDINSQKKSFKRLFKNIDYVFHLAGLADIVPSITNPEQYFNSNVRGTLNILQLSRTNKIKKFIYAASASCYGIPKKYPTDEKCKIDTKYPYALTKYLGEQLVMHWAKVYKMPNISLRFFNVYGPHARTTGAYGAVFGVFLAQKLANKPMTIVGDGNQTRDFIHVYDLVDAIIKIAKSAVKRDIFNLGGGKEVTVNKIAKLIGGKKIHVDKRPGEPDRSHANTRKIRSVIKWKPKISLEKGVSSLIKEIRDWRNSPVWTPNKIKNATNEWFKYLK